MKKEDVHGDAYGDADVDVPPWRRGSALETRRTATAVPPWRRGRTATAASSSSSRTGDAPQQPVAGTGDATAASDEESEDPPGKPGCIIAEKCVGQPTDKLVIMLKPYYGYVCSSCFDILKHVAPGEELEYRECPGSELWFW